MTFIYRKWKIYNRTNFSMKKKIQGDTDVALCQGHTSVLKLGAELSFHEMAGNAFPG